MNILGYIGKGLLDCLKDGVEEQDILYLEVEFTKLLEIRMVLKTKVRKYSFLVCQTKTLRTIPWEIEDIKGAKTDGGESEKKEEKDYSKYLPGHIPLTGIIWYAALGVETSCFKPLKDMTRFVFEKGLGEHNVPVIKLRWETCDTVFETMVLGSTYSDVEKFTRGWFRYCKK